MKPWPILLAMMFAAPAWAQEEQDPAKDIHTHFTVKAEPATVRPGDFFELVFDVKMDPEWHVYSANGTYSPTEWIIEGPFQRSEAVQESKPKEHRQAEYTYDFHEGEFQFKVGLRLNRNAPAGPLRIKGKMTGQECDPNGCIVFEYPFETDLTVEKVDPMPVASESDLHTRIDSVRIEPAGAKPGHQAKVLFTVAIDPKWHIASAVKDTGNRTRWTFDLGSDVEQIGPVEEPEPKYEKTPFADGGFLETWTHEEKVTFSIPVRIKQTAKAGALKLSGTFIGQECSNVCVEFEIPFTEKTAAAGAKPPAPQTSPEDNQDASTEASKEFEARGLGWLMGIAVLGGLVSLVMPCVYPLIPITITFFAKQAGASRSQGLLLSFAYAAGIILTFTGLGFLLTLLIGAQGAQIFASNPWVNLVIAAVFAAFALSLLGLFEFKLPAFVTNMTGSSGPRTGVGGAFILGLLFSVVTFTCTIPFAGTILAVAASEGHKAAGLAAMFLYSLVMAIPFIFLGLFPSMVKEIPKSGGWLHTMKVAAGLFEIALAGAYIWKADLIWGWGFFDRPVVLSIWIAVSFILALYLLGLFRVRGDSENTGVGIGRILSGLAFGAIGFYLIGGLVGRPLGVFGIVLPPDTRQTSSNGGEAPDAVFEHLADAEKKSRESGKPIFIEFTGIT